MDRERIITRTIQFLVLIWSAVHLELSTQCSTTTLSIHITLVGVCYINYVCVWGGGIVHVKNLSVLQKRQRALCPDSVFLLYHLISIIQSPRQKNLQFMIRTVNPAAMASRNHKEKNKNLRNQEETLGLLHKGRIPFLLPLKFFFCNSPLWRYREHYRYMYEVLYDQFNRRRPSVGLYL